MLGSPFGAVGFVELWLANLMEELRVTASNISDFPDSQKAYLLLAMSFRHKVQHLMRTLPWSVLEHFMDQFDAISSDALATILHVVSLPVDLAAWKQACLPLRSAGLGLGVLKLQAHAAYVAARFVVAFPIVQVLKTIKFGYLEKRATEFLLQEDHLRVSMDFIQQHSSEEFSSLLNQPMDSSVKGYGQAELFNIRAGNDLLFSSLSQEPLESSVMPPSGTVQLSNFSNLKSDPNQTFKLQHRIYTNLVEVAAKAWGCFSNSSALDVDLKRRVSVSAKESGAFLSSIPSYISRFTPLEFQTSVLVRLGLPLPFIAPNKYCKCAKHPLIDQLSYHLHTCFLCGDRRTRRHDVVKHVLAALGKEAGIKTVVEPMGLFRIESISREGVQKGPSNLRPDILFENPRLFGPATKNLIVDVSVVFPMSKSVSQGSEKSLPSSDQSKCKKYCGLAQLNDLDFEPMVMETYGKWHARFSAVVRALVHAVHEKKPEGVAEHVILDFWTKRLSVAVQTFNARMLISRYQLVAGPDMSKEPVYDYSNFYRAAYRA